MLVGGGGGGGVGLGTVNNCPIKYNEGKMVKANAGVVVC